MKSSPRKKKISLALLSLMIQFSALKAMSSDKYEPEHEHEHDHDHVHDQEPVRDQEHDEDHSFKISPEASKTFDLQVQKMTGKRIELPRAALVEIKNDQFVYRLREGRLEKQKIKILSKTQQKWTVELSEYKEGDQIVISALGFVRTVEMAGEEGVAHGHSH